jgi:hypothetical protein
MVLTISPFHALSTMHGIEQSWSSTLTTSRCPHKSQAGFAGLQSVYNALSAILLIEYLFPLWSREETASRGKVSKVRRACERGPPHRSVLFDLTYCSLHFTKRSTDSEHRFMVVERMCPDNHVPFINSVSCQWAIAMPRAVEHHVQACFRFEAQHSYFLFHRTS